MFNIFSLFSEYVDQTNENFTDSYMAICIEMVTKRQRSSGTCPFGVSVNEKNQKLIKFKTQRFRNFLLISIKLIHIELCGGHAGFKSTCSSYR
jgi:hypothetical protein